MNIDPRDENVMRAISKLALEQAFQTVAGLASKAALDMRSGAIPDMSGPEALELFAATILGTNAATWPTGKSA